jgi:hypothetical protein
LLAGNRLGRRVTRLLGDAVHGLEHENGELSAHLIRIEIRRFDRPAQTRGRVSGLSLVHDERDDIIRALLAGAKLAVCRRELAVYFPNGSFERASHPAMGSG